MLRSEFLHTFGATSVAALTPLLTAPTTTVALVAPLSGSARGIGLQLQAGVQGAIDELNQYAVLGSTTSRTFAVRVFDDQNTVANAILQAQFACGDSTVIATIGHVNADATEHALPTYAAASMPLVAPVCTDDRLTETQYLNVFRLQTKDSTEGLLFARDVIKQHNPKKPYIFVQDADYGADVANGFIDGMNAAKIVTPYQQFSYNKPDFGAVVDKALAVAPDYVFLAGVVSDMGPIVPMLRAKGYTGPIGASQGFFDAATLKLGAPANDLVISSSMPYLPYAPGSLRWVNDYQPHHGTMTPAAAFGYAAMQLIAASVTRSSAGARNVLLNAMQTPIAVQTVVGDFTFSGKGDQLDPQIYFYSVNDGKFSYLHQAHPAPFMIK